MALAASAVPPADPAATVGGSCRRGVTLGGQRRESDSVQSCGRSKPSVISSLTEHAQDGSDSLHVSLSVEICLLGAFLPDQGMC